MMLCNHEEIAAQIAPAPRRPASCGGDLHNLVGLPRPRRSTISTACRSSQGRDRPDGRGRRRLHIDWTHTRWCRETPSDYTKWDYQASIDECPVLCAPYSVMMMSCGPNLHVLRRGHAGGAEDARRGAAACIRGRHLANGARSRDRGDRGEVPTPSTRCC
jgi:hypothetical protein